jgi:hypothetical protein
MEATRSFETLVSYNNITLLHNAEDLYLKHHRRGSLKFHFIVIFHPEDQNTLREGNQNSSEKMSIGGEDNFNKFKKQKIPDHFVARLTFLQ